MNILGIIAEYNPFHNGHNYQLSTCKKMADADYTVIILGSDFNQRGLPCIVNKYIRTTMALSCGADLVIEMPQLASSGSAAYFSGCGISLLDHLGVITHLGFGSECGDINVLNEAVQSLENETTETSRKLQNALKNGATYAAARNAAFFPETKSVNQPNNILAVEYLKALHQRKSHITPVTVKRTGMNYNDTLDQQHKNLITYSSASAIRQRTKHLIDSLPSPNLIVNAKDIAASMPAASFDIFCQHLSNCYPLTVQDFYAIMRFALISCKNPSKIFDISTDFSNRLKSFESVYGDYDFWVEKIKSKNYTWSKVSRSLTHMMLHQTKTDALLMADMDNAPYVRILGFKKNATPLLKAVKNNCDLPVITKMADATKLLSANAITLFEKNIFSARIYKSVEQTKTAILLPDEYQHSPIIQ